MGELTDVECCKAIGPFWGCFLRRGLQLHIVHTESKINTAEQPICAEIKENAYTLRLTFDSINMVGNQSTRKDDSYDKSHEIFNMGQKMTQYEYVLSRSTTMKENCDPVCTPVN